MDAYSNVQVQYDEQGGSMILILNASHAANDGWYQCTAYNAHGSIITRARVVVDRPVELPQIPHPVKMNIQRTRTIQPEYETRTGCCMMAFIQFVLIFPKNPMCLFIPNPYTFLHRDIFSYF